MFLSGLHIEISSEKPNYCRGSVRGDELVGEARFLFSSIAPVTNRICS